MVPVSGGRGKGLGFSLLVITKYGDISDIKMAMVRGRVFQISKWYRYRGVGGGGVIRGRGGGEQRAYFLTKKQFLIGS